MYRIFSVTYLDKCSKQVKSCYVFASSVREALSLIPKDYVVKDIISSIAIDYHPFSPKGQHRIHLTIGADSRQRANK